MTLYIKRFFFVGAWVVLSAVFVGCSDVNGANSLGSSADVVVHDTTGRAGQVIAIDPDTGQLRAPTAQERTELNAAGAKSSAELTVIEYDDGSASARLGPEHWHRLEATIVDGGVKVIEKQGVDAVQRGEASP